MILLRQNNQGGIWQFLLHDTTHPQRCSRILFSPDQQRLRGYILQYSRKIILNTGNENPFMIAEAL